MKNNLFTYTICNPNKLTDLYTRSDKGNYYLGRTNNNTFAPSKYSIDVFDPSWDRRWENTFMTAFGMFSMTDPDHQWVGPYAGTCVTITPPIVKKYGINTKFTGKKIYPYIDMKVVEGGAYNQYVPSGVWPKGETSGNPDKLLQVKNAYVVDYPVALDDNRFAIVMSKETRTPEEKAQSQYFTLNIDDLYGSSEYSTEFKTEQFDGTNSYQLYPSLIKFNWCYNGSWGSGLNTKNGDMMIMRTAEIYLIAAEACQQLNDPALQRNILSPCAYVPHVPEQPLPRSAQSPKTLSSMNMPVKWQVSLTVGHSSSVTMPSKTALLNITNALPNSSTRKGTISARSRLTSSTRLTIRISTVTTATALLPAKVSKSNQTTIKSPGLSAGDLYSDNSL